MQRSYRILIFILLLLPAKLMAQIERLEKDSIASRIRIWNLTDDGINKRYLQADTTLDNFQVMNPVEQGYLSAAFLGNSGLAHRSNHFFEQTNDPFIFARSFAAYGFNANEIEYFNTTKPHTILYHSTSSKQIDDQALKVLHTQNINRNFNVAFQYKMLKSKGQYLRQASKNNSFGVSSNLIHKRYSLHFAFSHNRYKMQENGGVKTDSVDIENNFMPVRLNNHRSVFFDQRVFLSQDFSLGKKMVIDNKDTIHHEDARILNSDSLNTSILIPKSTWVHTFELRRQARVFMEDVDMNTDVPSVYDSIYCRTLINTLQWHLKEGFIERLPVGLSALLGSELIYQHNLKDYIRPINDSTYSNTFIGGNLYKRLGNNWNWGINARYYLSGYRQNDHWLKADFSKPFGILKDTMLLQLQGRYAWTNAYYFEQRYYAQDVSWHKHFDDRQELTAKASIASQKWRAAAGFNIASLGNHIYFDKNLTPQQSHEVLLIWSLYLKKDFHFGHFRFQNKLLYQLSSNESLISLPQLAYRGSLLADSVAYRFLHNRVQLGLTAHYHTAFFAPGYSPYVGMFYNQTEEKHGYYWVLDAFLNIRFNRVRLSFKIDHANSFLTEAPYYPIPDYPMDDITFKFAVAWMFWD